MIAHRSQLSLMNFGAILAKLVRNAGKAGMVGAWQGMPDANRDKD